MKKAFVLIAASMLLCGGTVVSPSEKPAVKGQAAIVKLGAIASSMDSTATSLDRTSQLIENLKP